MGEHHIDQKKVICFVFTNLQPNLLQMKFIAEKDRLTKIPLGRVASE